MVEKGRLSLLTFPSSATYLTPQPQVLNQHGKTVNISDRINQNPFPLRTSAKALTTLSSCQSSQTLYFLLHARTHWSVNTTLQPMRRFRYEKFSVKLQSQNEYH